MAGKSRRQRRDDAVSEFDKAISEAEENGKAEGLKDAANTFESELEELKDELQSWLDGMPENLQQSSKAEELESAISQLDEAVGSLSSVSDDQDDLDDSIGFCREAIDNAESVEFPGMR